MKELKATVALVAILFMVALSTVYAVTDADFHVSGLRIEHLRTRNRDGDGAAMILIDTPTPTFSWVMVPNDSIRARGCSQAFYKFNLVDFDTGSVVFDSGKVKSDANMLVYDGPALAADKYYEWTIEVWDSNGDTAISPSSVFVSFDSAEFGTETVWIGGYKRIRREFESTTANAGAKIKRATLYMTGLGWYSLSMNGNHLSSNELMTPAWTEYNRTVYYSAYDCTQHVRNGVNALGVELGGGFYIKEGYGDIPILFLKLRIHYDDGSMVSVSSDASGSWKGAAESPVEFDDVYIGENYSAIIEQKQLHWDEPYFNETSSWEPILQAETGPNGVLVPQMLPPIKIVGELKPVAVTQPQPGKYVVDFGQNFAGFVKISSSSSSSSLDSNSIPAGTVITLKHAEILLKDGMIDQRNLRKALSIDHYTVGTNLNPLWSWSPKFTYHGFRYLEVSFSFNVDIDADIVVDMDMHDLDIIGLVLSNDVCYDEYENESVGGKVEFTGGEDSQLLNAIQNAVIWTEKSNLLGFPTSCCNRDERTGWLGDAGLSGTPNVLYFDLHAIHRSYLHTIRDSQILFEGVPDVSPKYSGRPGPADPAWGTAFPWLTYLQYKEKGDIQIVVGIYDDGLKEWIKRQGDDVAAHGIEAMLSKYGDWQPPPPHQKINGSYVSGFYYMRDLHVMSKLAYAIGHIDDAEIFKKKRLDAMTEFNTAWKSDPPQYYGNGTQAELSMALATSGLIVDSGFEYTDVSDALIDQIEANQYHLSTGIHGTYSLFTALGHDHTNRTDVMLDMLLEKGYPSYGYMVTNDLQPGTTVWELWDAPISPDQTIANSRNHPMKSSVAEMFMTDLVGIRQRDTDSHSAYSNPVLVVDLALALLNPDVSIDGVFGKLNTVRGEVSLIYASVPNNSVKITIKVPVGAVAALYVPMTNTLSILDVASENYIWKDGGFISGAPGVIAGDAAHEWNKKWIKFELESGKYVFLYQYK